MRQGQSEQDEQDLEVEIARLDGDFVELVSYPDGRLQVTRRKFTSRRRRLRVPKWFVVACLVTGGVIGGWLTGYDPVEMLKLGLGMLAGPTGPAP